MSSNIELRQKEKHDLEILDYLDSDASTEIDDSLFEFTSKSVNRSIEGSKDKIKPVVPQKT